MDDWNWETNEKMTEEKELDRVLLDEPIIAVVHECTFNDTNGNPRRVFVGLAANGSVARITNEGYVGKPNWVRKLNDNGVWETTVKVLVKQYKDRIQMIKKGV